MKKIILSTILMIFAGSSFIAISQPLPAYAECNAQFFGLPAWYRGLTDGDCKIKSIGSSDGLTVTQFFWTVVANIIDCVFRIAGIAAVGFIIWGGFQYMTAVGDPGKLAGAKNTLINAVIGLAIAILSSVIVNTVLGIFK